MRLWRDWFAFSKIVALEVLIYLKHKFVSQPSRTNLSDLEELVNQLTESFSPFDVRSNDVRNTKRANRILGHLVSACILVGLKSCNFCLEFGEGDHLLDSPKSYFALY